MNTFKIDSGGSSEKDTLIHKPKPARKWAAWILVAIVVVIVTSIVTVIVYFKKHNGTSVEQKLGDVLPKSFSADFSLQKQGIEGGHLIKIEWDLDKKILRYRETDREQSKLLTDLMALSDKSQVLEKDNLDITIVNGEAVLNVFDGESGSWTWSCIPSLYDMMFYQVIQFAEVARKTINENKTECNGNVWSYCRSYDCFSPIYFCEKDSSLVSIKQDEAKATVLDWTVPATNLIQLPDQNVSCEEIRLFNRKYDSINDIEAAGSESKDEYSPTGHDRDSKTCLFVHGTGEIGPKTGYDVAASLADYWGNVESYVSRCTTKRFIRFDTVTRGWDDPELHRSFCRFASAGEDDFYISDKIIYSHSMGNLIIAAALYHGMCKFNDSSEWYSLQGPWRGSRVADWLADACYGKMKRIPQILLPSITLYYLKKFHYCTSAGTPSKAYQTLRTTYRSADGTSFTDLIAVGKKYVSGILCGDSSWGMGKSWIYSAALFAIQLVTDLPDPNDGMVNFDFSCAMDSIGRFSTNYRSRFYRSKANHAEGTCRHGDIGFCPLWWEKEQLYPCRWFQYS